ncbi:hypothetical protein H0H81_000088 [Sphagnurus paluster]|uniref:DNA-formamidopyrimidine glycosylase n=1 Tax=Sphagnurus paluster TaxID=117069 RepID=A0A9P7GQS8_9AGAR|nr:hypothetical protein H0H81_000088 [Sphagnurus paluster]
MPELPEVEKATGVVRTVAVGKRIERVETVEDDIVFSGVTHEEFAKEITGRRVANTGRYGKCFYLELDGEGRMPVLHFGMTGMLQVKGELATYYRETPKSANTDWPPKRFMKFILHLVDDVTGEVAELAFLDARRLGRIRLCASPLTEPPISELGFDPILCMPIYEDFEPSVLKRTCPIKALLLDQSFSAGVGNWVAALHHQTGEICRFAVSVNADDSKFPDHWLFQHRWGKGKNKEHSLKLPNGEPATIKWVTVGGRTSAYVAELQVMLGGAPDVKKRPTQKKRKAKGKHKAETDDDESDLTPLSESESESAVATKRKRPLRGKPYISASGYTRETAIQAAEGNSSDDKAHLGYADYPFAAQNATIKSTQAYDYKL